MTDYDVVIVGAGVAGLTAARHAAAGDARVLVLDRLGVGGQVSSVEGLINAPGRAEPIAGYELGVELLEEAEAAGAEILLAEMTGIEESGDAFVLTGADDVIRARTVIVAAGSERRRLDVVGEQEFEGQGVSRCASCDGPFFRDKQVIVVGGGDSAFDEARVLAAFASEVHIVHSGSEPTARTEISAQTLTHPNVRLHAHSTVSAIRGEDNVSAVAIRDLSAGTETEVPANGVFIYVGLSSNTDWIGGFVDYDASGRITVDENLAASRTGVYAAGDIRSGSAAMLVEAASDGERAARAALTFLAEARESGSSLSQ